jgi:hypothetical protein
LITLGNIDEAHVKKWTQKAIKAIVDAPIFMMSIETKSTDG